LYFFIFAATFLSQISVTVIKITIVLGGRKKTNLPEK